jgi:hypothetical protein
MHINEMLALVVLVIAGLTAFDGAYGWATVFIILACGIAS